VHGEFFRSYQDRQCPKGIRPRLQSHTRPESRHAPPSIAASRKRSGVPSICSKLAVSLMILTRSAVLLSNDQTSEACGPDKKPTDSYDLWTRPSTSKALNWFGTKSTSTLTADKVYNESCLSHIERSDDSIDGSSHDRVFCDKHSRNAVSKPCEGLNGSPLS